ncbi:hypothetical protein ACGFWD_32700 [Streptomyces sp. NPDC048448]|uniref:hypothetical protein n=1 Tax=Streptomyces sp. NPDC048448 TaxID=3365554 RepID=UPI00371E7749
MVLVVLPLAHPGDLGQQPSGPGAPRKLPCGTTRITDIVKDVLVLQLGASA